MNLPGQIVLAVWLLVGFGVPAHAVMQTLTVSGNDGRYWPDEVTRTTSGSASGSFTLGYVVRQFNPLLGDLIRVNVTVGGGNDRGGSGPGAIEIGLSPNGPDFEGGSGSVSGSATLGVEMLLPTAFNFTAETTVNGSHSGSIAGPPGANSSDQIDVPLEFTGSRTFILSGDLALFEGTGTVPFRSTLSISVNVSVADPGPDFGIGASLIPGLGTDATITYTFEGPIFGEGDYNASGQVEQGDLDLVLQNWGRFFSVNNAPSGWVTGFPQGIVDQGELDSVLQNWGSTASPDFGGLSVPEPGVLAGLIVALSWCGARRR